MINKYRVFTLVVALLVGACAWSPPKPVVDYNPEYAFNEIHSFAFGSQAAGSTKSLMDARIIAALRSGLKQQGWQETDISEADVLIRFLLSTQDKQSVRTYDRYYGGAYRCWRCGSPGYAQEVQVVNYTEGQLVVDIVDPSEKRAIWRAVSTGKVGQNLTPEERDRRITAVVERMLESFPPQGG